MSQPGGYGSDGGEVIKQEERDDMFEKMRDQSWELEELKLQIPRVKGLQVLMRIMNLDLQLQNPHP